MAIKPSQTSLEQAYKACETLARSHYENFPVASRFLGKHLRRPIAAIYTFGRTADDIADEGYYTPEERLALLADLWEKLKNIKQPCLSTDPLFIALAHTIQTHCLPISLFFDLLTAFKQDVIKKTYANFNELTNYCQHSAHPIGRLLLHLTNNASEAQLKASDDICTALQLINFLQDIQSDYTVRHRCYLPQDEMQALNITLQNIHTKDNHKIMHTLIHQQLKRAQCLLNQGSSSLSHTLKGCFGFEIRLIIASAQRLIRKLYTRKNVYERSILKCWDWPIIIWNAF